MVTTVSGTDYLIQDVKIHKSAAHNSINKKVLAFDNIIKIEKELHD